MAFIEFGEQGSYQITYVHGWQNNVQSEDVAKFESLLARLNRGRERSPLPPFVQMRPEVPNGAPRFVEQSHGQGAGSRYRKTRL